MDITWHGHSCFRLKSSTAAVVCDPYGKSLGLGTLRLKGDVLTMSHEHPGHNYAEALKGSEPFVIAGPGEYEVKGVFVVGVRTAHDARDGGNLGLNTAYSITMEGLTVCHLGDLGHKPTQAQVEELGVIDVLLVPVGGHNTISPGLAAEVVNLLDPSLVIPMHYRSPNRPELEPLEAFLAEMGVSHPVPVDVLKVSPTKLPDEAQVVLLEMKV